MAVSHGLRFACDLDLDGAAEAASNVSHGLRFKGCAGTRSAATETSLRRARQMLSTESLELRGIEVGHRPEVHAVRYPMNHIVPVCLANIARPPRRLSGVR